MRNILKAAAAGALAVLFVSPNAQAQLAVAKVVASCGTVSTTPHVGTNYPLTLDITGTLCTVGGGSGGGGTSSNFGAAFPGAGTAAGAEYLSVAPTLTTGEMVALQTDINGNLKTVSSGTPALPTGAATAANQEVTAAGTSATSAQAVQGVTGGVSLGVTDTSFHSSGNYVNAATVTTSANHALTGFVGPNALLKNYGTTQIAFHQAAASTTVTVATADGIIEPGGTWEIALGTGTNIATASVVSGAISGTGALQIIDGTGLWSGSGGGGGGSTGSSVAITGPLGAGAESVGVSVTLSGTKTTASPALPTGGAGGIGWLSDIDANVQAGFETATTSSRVIPASNVTPIDCSGTATGTPGNVTGLGITTIHGFTIQNQSGSVSLGISFVGTASIGSPGTFTLLPTGQSPNSYTTPVGFGSNHSVSVVATSSDVYSCVAF